jgi:excisionase family DNA binding protein
LVITQLIRNLMLTENFQICVHILGYSSVWLLVQCNSGECNKGNAMNQNQPSSEVLTVNEIAGYLRVSETTVWRWCNSGKLPAFRIGRSWRIRRTDLEQHIKQSVAEPELYAE